MRELLTELGGLTTRVVDNLPEDEKPSLAVVLCHGFGAPQDDLVPVGAHMLQESAKLSAAARFYFPGGPLNLSSYGMFGSAAWWMIDLEAIERAMRDAGFRARMRDEVPDGLVEARSMLLALIDEVRRDTGLGVEKLALGGFSQGSMLTVDAAMHLKANPAALIAWSGTLLNENEWRKLGPARKGLKVVQSHGRQDPMLPYAWAEHLRDTLRDVGMDVEFIPFEGPHTIPPRGLQRALEVLEVATAH